MSTLDLEQARAEFAPTTHYLNTASMGLPPRRTLEAMDRAHREWRDAVASPPDFDAPVNRARGRFARLVGVPSTWVAIGHQTSPLVGLVAAAVPDAAEVLVAEGEFTSVSFPFLAQARRGVRVREVPLSELAAEVRTETHVVAVATAQSADGRLADVAALQEACRRTDTRLLLDLTQSAGWLPLDVSGVDYTVCSAYKWLLSPRGTAFMTVHPDRWDDLIPHAAGWYAGDDPWDSIYGAPLRLARDARRFDTSPAWHAFVGTDASLSLLEDVGLPALHRHGVGLANRFLAGIDRPPGESAIVSLAVDQEAPALLARHGIQAAVRAGRLRLSFHVSNGPQDADVAASVLAGHTISP